MLVTSAGRVGLIGIGFVGLALGACGRDEGVRCGVGTVEIDGECVAAGDADADADADADGDADGDEVDIMVNVTIDYPNPTNEPHSWAPVYYVVTRENAAPAGGWSAQQAVCCTGLPIRCGCCLDGCTSMPLMVSVPQRTTAPATFYVFAYWALDGASSGPGAADPAGSAQIDVVPGTYVYNAVVTLCSDASCRACVDATSCDSGEVCVSGTCQGCLAADQCPPGQACVLGREPSGRCSACTSNNDCRLGEVCSGGACAGCTTAAECVAAAAGNACLDGLCASCSPNNPCLAGTRCGCSPCSDPSQCPSTMTCASGSCR